jgi:hypothetical protein
MSQILKIAGIFQGTFSLGKIGVSMYALHLERIIADLKCHLPFISGGFLNQWFAHYGEAKAYQERYGGFLL